MLYPNIKDPPKKRKKGTKDKRPKSTLEKQCNKLKGHIKAWKNRAEKASIKTRATALKSVKEYMDVSEGATISNPADQGTLSSIFDEPILDDCFNVEVVPYDNQ
ncbi:Cytochrome b-c1 complex subunit 1 mitochondrial [Bienertia sinuspersici]